MKSFFHPQIWAKAFGIEILSPDGWDRRNFDADWNQIIPVEDFMRKMSESTVLPLTSSLTMINNLGDFKLAWGRWLNKRTNNHFN